MINYQRDDISTMKIYVRIVILILQGTLA